MFDVEGFLLGENIPFRIGRSIKGVEFKVTCPACHTRDKLWCASFQESYICHKCRWQPDNTRWFVISLLRFFGAPSNRFKVDSCLRKYQRVSREERVEDVVERELIGGVPSSESVAYREQSSFLTSPVKEPEERPPLELPDNFFPLGDPRIESVNKYAFSRGFSFKLLRKHRVGGCVFGRYSGCVILPAYHGDELMFWQARDALEREKLAKYRTPLGYSPSYCLFNLDYAPSYDPVIICEGFFSALRVGPDAVATFGNKVSSHQAQLLWDKGVRNVVLCHDPDTWTLPRAVLEQGITTMNPPVVAAVENLLRVFGRVRVASLVGGDPDDLGREKVRERIDASTLVENRMDLAKLMVRRSEEEKNAS